MAIALHNFVDKDEKTALHDVVSSALQETLTAAVRISLLGLERGGRMGRGRRGAFLVAVSSVPAALSPLKAGQPSSSKLAHGWPASQLCSGPLRTWQGFHVLHLQWIVIHLLDLSVCCYNRVHANPVIARNAYMFVHVHILVYDVDVGGPTCWL